MVLAPPGYIAPMRNGLAIYAGGNHVFYILGVLKYLLKMGLKFDAIATYSAGASILPLVIGEDLDRGVEVFSRYLDNNQKNMYPRHALTKHDVFPHDRIYRSAIDDILDYDILRNFDRPLRVIVAQCGGGLLPNGFIAASALVALSLYAITARYTESFVLSIFKKLFSVEGQVIDIRRCTSREDVVQTILGSSTVYPFIKLRTRRGRLMLDGKLSLMTPIGALDDCENVLSIHAHRTFPTYRASLHQIFPLTEVNAGPLNYVGSAEIRAAFSQGYAEGKTHYARLQDSTFFEKRGSG